MTTMTLEQAQAMVLAAAGEAEAAAEENLAIIAAGSHTAKAVKRYQDLRDLRDGINAQLEDVKSELLAAIDEAGAQALVLNGSVVARKQVVQTPRVDSKALKASLPAIYEKFTKVTEAIRLTVSKA